MRVLRNAGVAPVNDPSDAGSAEASQHEILCQSALVCFLHKCDNASRQEQHLGRTGNLECVQYERLWTSYTSPLAECARGIESTGRSFPDDSRLHELLCPIFRRALRV